MSTLTDGQIWTLTTGATYRDSIRETIEEDLGLAVSWTGTADGAWTVGASELAFRVDQGMALLIACLSPETCPPAVLYSLARYAGLTPVPATYAQILLSVDGAPATVSTSATVTGPAPAKTRWRVIGAGIQVGSTYVEYDVSGDEVIVPDGGFVRVEALTAGYVDLPDDPAGVTLTPKPAGEAAISYAGTGAIITTGSDPESASRLRQRLRERQVAGGSRQGILTALSDVPQVLAASMVEGQGTIAVSLAVEEGLNPGVLAAAEVLAATKGAGIQTIGGSDAIYYDLARPDGGTVRIYLQRAGVETVDVSLALSTDGSVSDADAMTGATAAVQATFARLEPGDTIRYLHVLSAVGRVPGVIGALLTLEGVAADVAPSVGTSILIPVITVGVP